MKIAVYLVALTITSFLLCTVASAGDLNDCLESYCSVSCNAVYQCGFQAKSQVSSCKKSCKPAAKQSIKNVAKNKRLSSCRASKKNFRQLSCAQIGSLLGISGGGNGNTKRSYSPTRTGIKLGKAF